jgi:hypothetical protein
MATDTKELYEWAAKAEVLAGQLDRTWIIQAGIGLLGLLYITDAALAAALAANFRLETGLIQIACPLATLYFLVRMGYLLARYLEYRAPIVAYVENNESSPDRRRLELAARDSSPFGILSWLPLRTWNLMKPRPGKTVHVLSVLALLLLILCWGGVVGANQGISAYLVLALTDPLPIWLSWVIVVGTVVMVFPFYYQFYLGIRPVLGRWTPVIALSLYGLVIFTLGVLVWLAPVSEDDTHLFSGRVANVALYGPTTLVLAEPLEGYTVLVLLDRRDLIDNRDVAADFYFGVHIVAKGERASEGVLLASQVQLSD